MYDEDGIGTEAEDQELSQMGECIDNIRVAVMIW